MVVFLLVDFGFGCNVVCVYIEYAIYQEGIKTYARVECIRIFVQ